MAEKYLQKSIKTVEVNGIDFLVRKYNPEDVFIMGQNLVMMRDKAKKRIELEKKDCEDCPEDEDKPLQFTIEEIQELGELDLRVVLLSCVITPNIVMTEFGKQKKDEIPFSVLDSNTANKLFKEIENYSLEVFEGVSFDSFHDESDGGRSDEDIPVLQATPEPVSGLISAEDESILEDEIGRIVRPDKGDGVEVKEKRTGETPKRNKRTKTRENRKNNKV